MKSKNFKKGWKLIDGKYIQFGKRVVFKLVYWDKEGCMCYGVVVRGLDKFEECWCYVEGKVLVGCIFVYFCLGDILQFICVKCFYERNCNDWCLDKIKYK